jgi:WD40 repeat protein
MASPSEIPAQRNPFRGLEPYRENDAIYGRDSDLAILRDRVFSGRTTLLFAASGAGKTSFLLAKALPQFRKAFCCCFHRDWTGSEPQTALVASLAASLKTKPETVQSLRDLLVRFRKPDNDYPEGFLLILDQFEELFKVHTLNPGFGQFIQELCDLINTIAIRGRLIIAMRDDFLGELSTFDNRIPDLFNNYFHLKSPDEAQAREIIRRTAIEIDEIAVQPVNLRILTDQLSTFTVGIAGKLVLARMNSQAPESTAKADEQQSIDGERARGFLARVDLLLRNAWQRRFKAPRAISEVGIRVKRSLLGRFGWRVWLALRRAFVAPWAVTTESASVKRNTVILPYLQIVCRELWDREFPSASSPDNKQAVFLSSWDSKKAPARSILDNFCKRTLNSLGSTRRKDIASHAFDFLITREGAKLPYEYTMLAEHMGEDAEELYGVLDNLSQQETRILLQYKRPDGSTWFELYHDMYAIIVHDWKRAYQAKRAEQRRRGLIATVLLAVLSLVLVATALKFIRYSSTIEATTDAPPVDSYHRLRSIFLFGPLLHGYADNLLASYWDRRAQRAGLDEDASQTLFFRLKGLALKDSVERRTEANSLISSFRGLKATFRNGTDAEISALAFSPYGDLIAAGSADGTIQMWDITKGGRVKLLRLGQCGGDPSESTPKGQVATTGRQSLVNSEVDPIHDLVFSPDGLRLGARTASGLAQTWDRDGKCYHKWQGISVLAFASTGHRAVVAFATGLIQIWWDSKAGWPATYPLIKARRASEQIILSNVVFSTETNMLFAGDTAGGVYSWKVDKSVRGEPLVAHGEIPATFSPDATSMVTVANNKVQLWNLRQGHRVTTLDTDGPEDLGDHDTLTVSFAPDSKTLAITSFDHAQIFDARTGALEYSIPVAPAKEVQLGPNGILLVESYSGSLMLIDVAAERISDPLPQHGSVKTFSRSSPFLLTGSPDGAVRLWDAKERTALSLQSTSKNILLSDNGRIAVSQTLSGTILISDVITRRVLDSLHPNTPLSAFNISADGKLLAGIDRNKTLRIWSSGKQIFLDSSSQHSGPLAFSPDGHILIVGAGSSLRSFKVSSDNLTVHSVGTIQDGGLFEFTPDSKVVLVVQLANVDMFKAEDLKLIAHLPMVDTVRILKRLYPLGGEVTLPSTLMTYTFSSEGGIIAIFTGKQIQLLDWQTGRIVSSIDEPNRPSSLTFRPGGRELLAVFSDKIKIWNLAEKNWVERAATSESGFVSAYFRPGGNVGFDREDPGLLTLRRDGVLQLWNLKDLTRRGAEVKVASSFTGIPWFSSDGSRIVISTQSGWLHLFRIGLDGLVADGNRFVGGDMVSSIQVHVVDERFVVSVLAASPQWQLSVIDLSPQDVAALRDDPKKLLNDFQTKLSLDEQGQPANLSILPSMIEPPSTGVRQPAHAR